MAKTIGYPVKKITRTKGNLEAVARAKQLLEHARRERSSRESAWKRSQEQWLGHQWGEEASLRQDSDLVTVNMTFSTGNTILPYITGSDPSFIVEPYSGAANPVNARLQQAMLNREWRSGRMDGNAHLRRAAWHYLLEGDGYLKATYSFRPVYESGTATEKEIAELWVDKVSPWDVWIDPQADGLHNARWVIVRSTMSVDELKSDDRYSHTSMLTASSEPTEDRAGRPRPITPTGSERDMLVAVYEFYDIVARELVVFTSQSDLPMQVVKDIRLPLVVIPNHPIPNSPYSMGEFEQILPLQRELNKTRTQMMEHRRRNAAKWLVREGTLAAGAKAALQSETVNAVVEVTTDRPLEDLVLPLGMANLNAEVYAVDQIIKADINEVTGINEYLRGSTPEIRRTATEATIIEGASNVKTAHKLRQIEIAARQIGQLLLDIAADVYPMTDTDEMKLILTGKEAQAVAQVAAGGAPEGAPPVADTQMVEVEPSDDLFAGRYEVFVEQGSTELRNPQMREQKYREMVEMAVGMAPTLAQMGVHLNLRKHFEMWYEAAGIDDIDGMFQAPPPPPPQVPAPGGEGAGGGMGDMMGQMQIPPEIMASAQALLGGPGGGGQAAPAAPTDLIDPSNSGMLPPTG